MRITRTRGANFSADWYERLVILWQEDDCGTPDRELFESAYKRIVNSPIHHASEVATHDAGDAFYTLHTNGYVKCSSYDGTHLYMAVNIEDKNPNEGSR